MGPLVLEETVKKHIEKGWSPIGGVQIEIYVPTHGGSRSTFYQAMVKYEAEAL